MEHLYNSNFFTDFYANNGGGDYTDRSIWIPFFTKVADNIIARFNPKTVLDAGCAMGYLVELLRDRGVEAYGFDISEYAINNVRDDIKNYCIVHSITEPLPKEFAKKYDLVINVEVMEHLSQEMGVIAIRNLCSYTDTILFSSTPDDISDRTHVNVRLQEYWCKLFAENGFFRQLAYSVEFLSPWAMLFSKANLSTDIVFNYEMNIRIDKMFMSKKFSDYEANISDLHSKIADLAQNGDRLLTSNNELHDIINNLQNANKAYIEEIDTMKVDMNNLQNANKAYIEEINTMKVDMNNLNGYRNLYDNVIQSRSWRITKPLRFFCSILKKVYKIFNSSSVNPSSINTQYDTQIETNSEAVIKYDFLEDRFRGLQAIDSVKVETLAKRRLNLVTDSIGKDSLFGGVATALIVASIFAKKNNMDLRIITRNAEADPQMYYNILKINDVEKPENVIFYSDVLRDIHGKNDYKLELADNDIFLATSWWSAEAIRKTTIRKEFFYILQEVETFFYPHGDDHYLCSKIMECKNIKYIINSHFLWEYFEKHNKNIIENGVFFEPAFSKKLYTPSWVKDSGKRKLFFYSRPNNPRNLFAFGLNILDVAIQRGIIDTNNWEIYMVGQDVPDYEFCNGYHAKMLGILSWEKYSEFLKTVDLTLSLMYTPHPSYPPFDAACCGSVVISNTHSTKQFFDQCKNVLLSSLEKEEFLNTLNKAVNLAMNDNERKENYHLNTIPRDWNNTLTETLVFMEASCDGR